MADLIPTGRELEALKVLWSRGKATVREIYQAMRPRDGEAELAYTTVLSLLQTMEQKGLVGHEAAGKAYAYFPLVQRESTFRRLAGGFLDHVEHDPSHIDAPSPADGMDRLETRRQQSPEIRS